MTDNLLFGNIIEFKNGSKVKLKLTANQDTLAGNSSDVDVLGGGIKHTCFFIDTNRDNKLVNHIINKDMFGSSV
jgi:hypothetical protein